MRAILASLLAISLMSGAGAATPATYSLNISGNGQTITGTITTSGAAGVLTNEDFVAWTLYGSGTAWASVSDQLGSVFCGASCGVVASPVGLTFGGGAGPSFLEFASGPVPLQRFTFGPSAISVLLFYDVQFFQYGEVPVITPYQLASVVPIPEPATSALLGIGLWVVAARAVRRRRYLAAA